MIWINLYRLTHGNRQTVFVDSGSIFSNRYFGNVLGYWTCCVRSQFEMTPSSCSITLSTPNSCSYKTPLQSTSSSCLLKQILISAKYWLARSFFSRTQWIDGFVLIVFLMALWKSTTWYGAPGTIPAFDSILLIVYCRSHCKPWPKYLFSVLSSFRTLAHVPCFSHSCCHNESSTVPIQINIFKTLFH